MVTRLPKLLDLVPARGTTDDSTNGDRDDTQQGTEPGTLWVSLHPRDRPHPAHSRSTHDLDALTLARTSGEYAFIP